MKSLNSIFLTLTVAVLLSLSACGKKNNNNNHNNGYYNNPYGYSQNGYNNNYLNNGGYYNQNDGLSYLNSLCGGYSYANCAYSVPGTYYYQGIPCYQYQMQYPTQGGGYGWYNTYIPHYGYQTNQSGFNFSLGAYFAF